MRDDHDDPIADWMGRYEEFEASIPDWETQRRREALRWLAGALWRPERAA